MMQKKDLPLLAMVMCVRDEEDFIGTNLAYHHALGVSRAYIFADRCNDATIEIARYFPWVKVFEINIDTSKDMVTHQNKSANKALKMARDEGFQWLMHIDADEFAFADNLPFGIIGRAFPFMKKMKRMTPVQRGDLIRMLALASKRTEMILMRTWEAVPVLSENEQTFWKLHYFHNKSFEDRKVLDPAANKIRPLAWFGHARGKTIIRTSADVQSRSSHLWTRYQGTAEPEKIPLKTEYRGHHFHFLFTNSREWWNKFRKHSDFPDRWHSKEPVGFPKQSWKEASKKMSEVEAQQYFNEWLALPPDELGKRLAEGSIIKDSSVQDILNTAGWNGTDGREENH
ncbi:glycosyltransferase family 2 protein [Thermodesulfobacteriota bacterium]